MKASIHNNTRDNILASLRSSKSVDTLASIGMLTFPKNLCSMLHNGRIRVSYDKKINAMNGIKKIHMIAYELITVFHIIKCYGFHCLCDKMNAVLNKRFLNRRMYEYVSLKNAVFNMHALCSRTIIGSPGYASMRT